MEPKDLKKETELLISLKAAAMYEPNAASPKAQVSAADATETAGGEKG